MFDLSHFMNQNIDEILRTARSISLRNPRVLFYLRSFASAAKRAAKLRSISEDKGTRIPPFLIASITTNCNLFCTGCYARANNACSDDACSSPLDAQRWGELFIEARSMGVSFILLAGGEPLLRKDVLDKAAKVREILFPIFTNGTLIGADYLSLFDKNRNLMPILSMEGGKETTDARRGAGVYDALVEVMAALKRKSILFGVSVTVTKNNLDEITDELFIHTIQESGCSAVFYIEYVPADRLSYSVAPTEIERIKLDNKIKDLKTQHPMLFISFPGDEKDTGGCLAAGRGFFHINADGKAEPCPFSPFSDSNVKDHSLMEALNSHFFAKLRSGDFLLGEHTGGCHLFEKRVEVEKMLADEQSL